MVTDPAAFGYALIGVIAFIVLFSVIAGVSLWLWEDVWRFPTRRLGEWWCGRKGHDWQDRLYGAWCPKCLSWMDGADYANRYLKARR